MSTRPTNARYKVIAITAALAMVTYLDRACIGSMKTEISKDFDLDPAQFAWVANAFLFMYAIFEIPTARWADRRGAKSVLTRIVTWWSAFTILTAGAWNYASLLATRALFGVGEAGAWPCMARVMSRWIPLDMRASAKGLFFAAAYASAGVTTWAVPQLLEHVSWRTLLVIFGCVGFVWVLVWQLWFRDEPTDHPAANEAERALILADRPPAVDAPSGWAFWRRLMRQRNVLLLCFLYMPNCCAFYFCITWFPSYLREQHGYESAQLGTIASLPLFLSVVTQFLGGYWSDRVTRRRGVTAGRRTPGIAGYLLAAACIVGAIVSTTPALIATFIAVATGACMLTTAPAWSTCIDIGRENSATVGATMNTAGQFAAVVCLFVTGYSVKWTGSWNVPFWFLAGMFLMGAICWAFVEPKKPVMGGDVETERATPGPAIALPG
jgi:MFS transporter, ACS family, glucarate transporter